MGKQFCYCWEESWPTSQTRTSAEEKAKDLLGPKRPEWGIGAWALLHYEHWRDSWQVSWHEEVHHCRFQQRILDGGTTPQIMQTHHNGIGYQTVSMDAPSNGLCGGTGCISVETWYNLSQHSWSYWNCQWHNSVWTNQSRAWCKSTQLPRGMSEKQLDTKPGQDAVQTAQSLILRSHLEWQRTRSQPEEDWSGEEDENPQDIETMRSFLGMINYLNRFSPHLGELSDPLRQICRQKEEFQLSEACKDAFHRCKEEISKSITLPYFNPKSPTILQTDTSKKGLGAVLLQNSTPVMFASRALTKAEKNYQNLEWECLATIWGMEKFHYFLYGKQFTLETDQKPLVAIYKKHMVEISPRIQCLIARSFPYQPFDVQYPKGTRDTPSWCSKQRNTPTYGRGWNPAADNCGQWNHSKHSMQFQQFGPDLWRDKERSNAQVADALHHRRMASWQKTTSMRTARLLELSRRHVPRRWHCNQRSQDSDTIHAKKESPTTDTWRTPRSREMYAEGLRVRILAWNKRWHPWSCQQVRRTCQLSSKAAKPLGSASEVPPHPWHTLGTDLFYWNKIDFLVIGDYFTKFIIVRRLPNSLTHSVIKELGMVFTKFGRPFMY